MGPFYPFWKLLLAIFRFFLSVNRFSRGFPSYITVEYAGSARCTRNKCCVGTFLFVSLEFQNICTQARVGGANGTGNGTGVVERTGGRQGGGLPTFNFRLKYAKIILEPLVG